MFSPTTHFKIIPTDTCHTIRTKGRGLDPGSTFFGAPLIHNTIQHISNMVFSMFSVCKGHFSQDSRRNLVVLHNHNNTILHCQPDGTQDGRTTAKAHTKCCGIVIARKNSVRNTRGGIDHVIFQGK